MSITINPPVSTNRQSMRQIVRAAQAEGKSVGVVMTMGALHDGHLSLMRECTKKCDVTVVTIFVNPTQFLPDEDFQKYPRQVEADLAALNEYPVDIVFAPQQNEMYRPSHSTFIQPPRVAQPLEGACRPGHFRGVCTIVLKLLQAIPANWAFFGHKDYQQYLVLKQMAIELDLPVKLRVCPTIREPDGLALSSRNQYLSPEERRQAVSISRSLHLADELVRQGNRNANQLSARMRQELLAAGITRIDYVTVADADTLVELRELDGPAVALIAAYVGSTRLIDNLRLPAPA